MSFLISLVILGGLFITFFVYKLYIEAQSPMENVPYEAASYQPKSEESINILIIGCESLSSTPKLVTILGYDAVGGKITLSALPPEAMATVGVREDTIAGHYDYEGMRGAVSGVSNMLLCEVDRYVRLDRVGLANLIDYLGGIEYEVLSPMRYTDKDGYTEDISAGKQLLDGRRATAMLFWQNENSTVNTVLQNSLMTSLLDQRFKSTLVAKYPNFVSAFFYNAETNMNQYDFAMRERGITERLEKESFKISSEELQGIYNYVNSQFIADEKSLESLNSAFTKKGDQ